MRDENGIMKLLWVLGLFLLILAPGWSHAEVRSEEAIDSSEDASGITVLARGPVHEAFAQPANPRPQASPVIGKQPPAPIPEIPPDEQPRGKEVQWIPGYWDWDEEKTDYLWVSGTWRVPPPDRKWVPGYWSQAENGWQWVSGFWAPEEQKQVQYLSMPPGSAEDESRPPAPLTGKAYVPGIWVFNNYRYVWQPGYWYDCQQGWVWIPGYYVWTPAGYVWVEGYWDFCPEDRGIVYVPVYFDYAWWTRPGWCFTPRYSVNVACLTDSLFFRPGYSRYCFGNYYSSFYRSRGYRPWCYHGPVCHDPLFNYCSWANRGNRFWERGLCDRFRARSLGTALCPAVTLRGQTALLHQAALLRVPNAQGLNLVCSPQSLRDAQRVAKVPPAQLLQYRAALSHYQQVGLSRSRAERAGASFKMTPSPPNGGAVVSSFRLPTPLGVSHSASAAAATASGSGKAPGHQQLAPILPSHSKTVTTPSSLIHSPPALGPRLPIAASGPPKPASPGPPTPKATTAAPPPRLAAPSPVPASVIRSPAPPPVPQATTAAVPPRLGSPPPSTGPHHPAPPSALRSPVPPPPRPIQHSPPPSVHPPAPAMPRFGPPALPPQPGRPGK